MIDNPKVPTTSRSRFHLVGSNSTLYTHPMNPSSFGGDYIPDLIDELSENKDVYKINKRDPEAANISIDNLPLKLRMSLDYYRAQIGSNQPSIQTVLACCVVLGLRSIETNPHVRELAEIVETFNRHEKCGSTLELYAYNLLSLPLMSKQEAGTRFNLTITSQCKARIAALHNSTGLQYHAIAIMAAYVCLCEQGKVADTTIEEWQARLDGMFEVIKMKVILAKALNKELEELVWGPG